MVKKRSKVIVELDRKVELAISEDPNEPFLTRAYIKGGLVMNNLAGKVKDSVRIEDILTYMGVSKKWQSMAEEELNARVVDLENIKELMLSLIGQGILFVSLASAVDMVRDVIEFGIEKSAPYIDLTSIIESHPDASTGISVALLASIFVYLSNKYHVTLNDDRISFVKSLIMFKVPMGPAFEKRLFKSMRERMRERSKEYPEIAAYYKDRAIKLAKYSKQIKEKELEIKELKKKKSLGFR